MATTYFGYNTQGASNVNINNTTTWMGTFTGGGTDDTCPGTGNQDIKNLAAYVRYYSGGSGSFRLAVYRASDSALVCHGTNPVSFPSGWAWTGHDPATDITWVIGTTLVGGTKYKLAITASGTNIIVAVDGGKTSGDFASESGLHYVSNPFPSTIPSLTNNTNWFSIRCGVDAAASSISIPVMMQARRRRL